MRATNTSGRRLRLGAGALVLASCTVLPGAAVMAPAQATTATSAPAAAAEVVTRGRHCEGSQVERCVWVNIDRTNQRVRAWASVRDPDTGYLVAVRSVRINVCTTSTDNCIPWADSGLSDLDGWHDVEDRAHSQFKPCAALTVRGYATTAWRNAAGTETQGDTQSHAVAIGC